jgi:hypothetical protein
VKMSESETKTAVQDSEQDSPMEESAKDEFQKPANKVWNG